MVLGVFHGGPRVIQGCSFSEAFQGVSEGTKRSQGHSMDFGGFQGASRALQVISGGIRMSRGQFRGVLRCFRGASGCPTSIQKFIWGATEGLMEVSGCLRDIPGGLMGFRGVSGAFQEVQGVLGGIWRLQKDTRAFKES